ncbi:MAG: hypothetical protein KDD19_14070 [Phaeodactylibacter sp.]|nr:hypothetical protein [Phaeodactylibacter sp.]MCB9051891.1 hypothetical protein [Lewinellaceae bacterium]
MRRHSCLRSCFLLTAILFALPIYAGITFRIFTGGPQAGEVHIESPEGAYILFRSDFQNDEAPAGFCGIRWSAFEADELIWYWGNPGRMAKLPSNGSPTRELSYMARHSTCNKELTRSRFRTPSTPDGQAPPDAHLLVVEVDGWENVTFTNHQLQQLPLPKPQKMRMEGDICLRYPGFCEYSPGLERAYDDPCQHSTYGNLICTLLPAAQSALVRSIDLSNSMANLQYQMQEDILFFYTSKGLRHMKATVEKSQERMALLMYQFGQLHTAYQRLDIPLKQLNNRPFSHFAHASVFTHLDLAKNWLEKCRQKLNAIQAATEGKYSTPPQEELKLLEKCRQRACSHLLEARFWLERQYAWVVPMER